MPAFQNHGARKNFSRDHRREDDWTMTRAATPGDHDVARSLAVQSAVAPPSVIAGVILVGPDDTIGDSGLPDNYQPVESAWYIPGPTALIDVYTPNPSTTGTLVVDDPNHVIAACDTPGDNDWFAVTLTAGVTYQFGQYAYAGGIPGAEGNGVPLADAYLEIYDSAGNLLSIADGGGPNTPSGLDALMTFEATYSGTYYVNATSYDNDGDGVGDFAGDYEIFAITATGTTYTTHYDISSPLHSIDWGGVLVNREHVSVRNPDGMEGPRPTGEPAADPADVEGNALGFPGKNVIYLYFAGEGDTYANVDSTIPAQVTAQDPYQYEIQAMLTAANEFSKVADVVFVSNYTFNASTGLYERNENIEYKPGPLGPEAGVQYATGVDGDGFDADFFYWSYPGTPGPGISLLGSMSPPDYGDEGVAQFNSADERWNAQMLQQGGFSFVTLIHEFGHGMGLAHPHDTGGGSSVMHGVQTNGVPGDDGGAGDFDLNQGVNTMMSYNDGWEKSPYGQAETNNEGYGWLGSLMALDIAVIQDKYGVNEDWATGNDTYVLKDVNEWGVYIDAATGQPAVHDATNQATTRDGYYQGQGTYYSSIWDADGVDQIIYNGARDTTIDLRAATLQYEYGGAGWMSYADGIYGGFTIANSVVIENASSGAGNDRLIGSQRYGGASLYRRRRRRSLFYRRQRSGRGGGRRRLRPSSHHLQLRARGGIGGRDADDQRQSSPPLRSTSPAMRSASICSAMPARNTLEAAAAAMSCSASAATTAMSSQQRRPCRGSGGRRQRPGARGRQLHAACRHADRAADDRGQSGDDRDQSHRQQPVAIYLRQCGHQHARRRRRRRRAGRAGGRRRLPRRQRRGSGRRICGRRLRSPAGRRQLHPRGGLRARDDHHGGQSRHDRDRPRRQCDRAISLRQCRRQPARRQRRGDVMTGFGGADNFAFSSALGGGNVDRIVDFDAASDTILLDDAVFTGLAAGALGAGAFVLGTAAQDANDRILYHEATGRLFFDADGNGSGAAVLFATLDNHALVSAGDFTVI